MIPSNTDKGDEVAAVCGAAKSEGRLMKYPFADLELARRLERTEALLESRLRYAAAQGCTVAMMVAQPGSGSQRNSERHGFRIAYTRTKWQLQGDNEQDAGL